MLPGLTQLENTPEMLRLLMDGLTPEQGNWKPAPDRWSIAEVIEHLSHVEGHGFRARVDLMISEDRPVLNEYNQEEFAAAGQYSGRELEDSFDHWEDQRESNVEHLRALDDAVAKRQGQHEKFGIITVGDLLNEWAFHDLGHVRQIAELVRAQRYFPHMGEFRTIYQIRP